MLRVPLRAIVRRREIACIAVALLASATSLPAQSKATFAGSVRVDSSGSPIANAEVVIPSLGKRAYTDSAGRFRLENIEPGSYDVLVRRLGFSPVRTRLMLDADETTAQEFRLQAAAYQLRGVRVVSGDTARSLYVDNVLDFEHRRSQGFGTFIGAEELQAASDRQMTTVLQTIPDLRFYRLHGAMVAGSEESGRKCYAQVYYDGVKVMWAFDVNSLMPATLRGIEYYPNKTSAPGQFTASPGYCGVLVLWTLVRRE